MKESANDTVYQQHNQTSDIGLEVAVITGNEFLRRGLESLLQELSIVNRASYYEDWDEVCAALLGQPVDILLVVDTEYRTPVFGTECTKTLVVLDHSDIRDALSAVSVPPDGFLMREDLTPTGLSDALSRIAAGEIQMPAELARELMTRASLPPYGHSRPARLTARETETLVLLAKGCSNKQIARRLSISVHGAKRLVASLLLKLDSPNRTTAVITAIKSGLIDVS